jgi:hypothetical protein
MASADEGIAIAAAVIAVLVLIVVGPMFTIWSLNCLFGLGIPLTITTWASTLWLAGVVGGAGKAIVANNNKS